MRIWPRPHNCPDKQRVADCVAELSEEAGGAQYVRIGRVLEILDPEHRLAPAPPAPDPRADPLFGTLPVTAPGLPGGQQAEGPQPPEH